MASSNNLLGLDKVEVVQASKEEADFQPCWMFHKDFDSRLIVTQAAFDSLPDGWIGRDEQRKQLQGAEEIQEAPVVKCIFEATKKKKVKKSDK